jgi:hypothetical protein
MKTFFIILVSFCCIKSYAQGYTYPAHGYEDFKKNDTIIKSQCGTERYFSKKLKKRVVRKELKLVKLVDDVVLNKITIDSLLSILKTKSIKFEHETYEKNNHSIKKIIIHSEYIKYSLVIAIRKATLETYRGARLMSTYKLYCKKNAPESEIYAIDIDNNFFRDKVIKKISSKYQVYNNLALEDASYISDEIRIIF